jgi:putative ABC transport system permease protein
MTRFGLLLRNLRYFRAANVAVATAIPAATAVLTGALLVGDSVRGSLRELAIQRLGPVDLALVAPRSFDQSLAERVASDDAVARESEVVPALSVRGGAADAAGEHRTGGVQIAAVGGQWVPVAPGECVINRALADALGMRTAGETVALNVPAPGDVPRDATLARRSTDDVTSRPQLRVARIASEPGFASMFNLEGSQRLPRNAWMNLADLQREVRQPRRANLLLAKSAQPAEQLNLALKRMIRLDDYGLKLTPGGAGGAGAADEQVLSSQSTYIPPAVDEAAQRVASRIGVPLRSVSVQLIINVVRVDAARAGAEQASIHYAVAAGVSSLPEQVLAAEELALNEWAAARLGAKVGDRIRLDYYRRRGDGELTEVRGDVLFRVTRIIPMTGLGADRTLTPDYPGLTDKASIREAPPELGIKDELLTDEDEAYWKQHRAAPKVFVNLATARRLWGETHGELTSIRIPAARAAEFETELRKEIDPAAMGMSFRAIKAEQLAAATGSTDFSMLFVGLSFFLILSAALLAAMLFRLSVEARARQFGVLQAMGFTPRALYRFALAEGLLLAAVGGAVGLIGAIGYTWLIVAGLRTWWVDAVGTTALRLHVAPQTLLIGFFAGVAIAMLAVAWAARNLRRVEPVRLLSGAWAGDSIRARSPRIAGLMAAVGLIGGVAILAAGAMRFVSAQAAFFGGASLLLLGSLSAVAWMLRSGLRRRSPDRAVSTWSIRALALRTAQRHPARSLLTVSLVALASFLLVTVAAMRQGPPQDAGIKNSGTGGYRLILHADIPLLADLNTREGRERLGMREPGASVWSDARFTPLRRWAGQDASCLNLTRPESPTILGVPSDLIRQNRFRFAAATGEADNPWTLLEHGRGARADADADEVPVIADNETARYILKLGIGETLAITDQNGRPRRLRLVATLAGSMLQSELLMSEANFRRLFPFQSGAGVVLIETDASHAEEIQRRLSQELDAFAVTVESTAQRLAVYRQVANTYLSTFQTLGSLGLLLGTVGLAVVLLRGLIERRAELALLSALGFRPARRLGLVLGENASLLIVGLLAGTVCAMVGVIPAVMSAGRSIRLTGLLAALAAVLLSGLIVLAAAAWLGGRRISPADLRRE